MRDEPQTDPIPDGPLDTAPNGYLSHETARVLLLNELQSAGVEMGAYDRRIVEWLAGWDSPTVATIASLIRRTAHHPR
ncbi:hypothetical protein ABZS96_02305 [Streptomyces avermitilis]|uniref:hypothetical protein n=1 Tax=Streptomyces avermitilis TaxID=33903 RepID=UPI0033A784FB